MGLNSIYVPLASQLKIVCLRSGPPALLHVAFSKLACIMCVGILLTSLASDIAGTVASVLLIPAACVTTFFVAIVAFLSSVTG